MKFITGTIPVVLASALMFSGCAGKFIPPLKSYDKISIPDGEFLQYGKYVGGERTATIDFVSKIVSNTGNEAFLITYLDAARVNSDDRIPGNYSNYCSIKTISLKTGSQMESVYNFSRMTNKNINSDKSLRDPSRFPGEFYRHYTLRDGMMDMEIKTCLDGVIKDMRYREPVKRDYPVMDTDTALLFSFRFLDIFKNGIFYAIVPAIIKEPLPLICRVAGKEKIKTAAGEFDTVKLAIVLGDPFLGGLMDNYLKNSCLWMENSGRRLLVKMEAAGVKMELESVSNVGR